MANKHNEVVTYLAQNGFRFETSARAGYDLYRDSKGHEVRVPHNPNDGQITGIRREVDRAVGITAPKRSSSKSKSRARAKAERERAAENKRKAATAAIAADIDLAIAAAAHERSIRDQQLGGLGRNLTNREVRDVTAALEEAAAVERRAQRLITEIPLYGARR